MTNFDKALDDILLRHGAEQGELHYSLKEAIKALIALAVQEARIDELKLMQGGDIEFQRYSEDRIATLTNYIGETKS